MDTILIFKQSVKNINCEHGKSIIGKRSTFRCTPLLGGCVEYEHAPSAPQPVLLEAAPTAPTHTQSEAASERRKSYHVNPISSTGPVRVTQPMKKRT